MLQESTASTADSDHQPGTCRHCGAPLVRIVTSYQHNLVGDVCSVGWFADYSPFARPCGAPTTEDQDPRYSLIHGPFVVARWTYDADGNDHAVELTRADLLIIRRLFALHTV